MKQQEIKEKVKFLKWHEGVDYKTIATAIGMNKNSFYNFISNENINLSHKTKWKLENYMKEIENGKMGI